MPTSDLKIAAAYIRVSTDDQEEYSPDSQVRLIREYARKNGYLLPDLPSPPADLLPCQK